MGPHTYILLFHFQPGIPKPLSYESRINFYSVAKALFGSSEDFFRLCLGYIKARISPAGYFHGFVIAIHKENSISRKHCRKYFLHGR